MCQKTARIWTGRSEQLIHKDREVPFDLVHLIFVCRRLLSVLSVSCACLFILSNGMCTWSINPTRSVIFSLTAITLRPSRHAG